MGGEGVEERNCGKVVQDKNFIDNTHDTGTDNIVQQNNNSHNTTKTKGCYLINYIGDGGGKVERTIGIKRNAGYMYAYF